MIGDWLYQLLPRDQVGVAHEYYVDGAHEEGAANSLVADLDFPDDRLLVIHCICLRANGGIGQTVTDLQLSVCDLNSGEGTCRVFFRDQAGGQDRNHTLFPSGMVVLPPRSFEAYAEFSGALASNSLDLLLLGYTIPRANFAP